MICNCYRPDRNCSKCGERAIIEFPYIPLFFTPPMPEYLKNCQRSELKNELNC